MKMLLHLMGKELRYSRSHLIFFAVCLLAALCVPLVQRLTGEPHWSLAMVHFTGVLMITSVLMGLLVAWIHLDHPRDTAGFLQTRPLSPVMRWLPKFLCWVLFLMLPVLLGMLVQLMSCRLDLSTADYAKFTTRAFLRIISAYGLMALIAVSIRNHRIAALLCLPALIFTLIQRSLSSPTSFEAGEYLTGFDLETSRTLVAYSVFSVGGFVVAGMVLARCPWRAWLPASLGILGLSVLAEHYWPLDVMGLREPVLEADRERVVELESKVRVSAQGWLTLSHRGEGESRIYKTDPLKIELPAGSIEWPQLAGLRYDPLRLADGSVMASTQSVLTGDTTGWQNYYPTTPIQSLQVLLGHRAAGQGTQLALSDYRPQLRVVTQAALPNDVQARVAGRLDLSWFHPVLLADLPLEPGAFFSHQGRSVKLLGASSGSGQVRLKMLLTSFYPRPWHASLADQVPEFQILAAHPERREITLRSSDSRSTGFTSSLAVDELSFTANYNVLSADGSVVRVNPFWVQKARLYIVKRESIGRGSHRYEGDVTTHRRSSKP